MNVRSSSNARVLAFLFAENNSYVYKLYIVHSVYYIVT